LGLFHPRVTTITEDIEIFYNRQRLQARPGYVSPAVFGTTVSPATRGHMIVLVVRTIDDLAQFAKALK